MSNMYNYIVDAFRGIFFFFLSGNNISIKVYGQNNATRNKLSEIKYDKFFPAFVPELQKSNFLKND